MLKKRENEVKRKIFVRRSKKKQICQIGGKQPPFIPISMIGIERIEVEKKDFRTKTILSPIYFDGIS